MDKETPRRFKIVMPEDNTEVDYLTECFRENVRAEIAKSFAHNIPIVLLEPVTLKTYLKYPDGSKEYI